MRRLGPPFLYGLFLSWNRRCGSPVGGQPEDQEAVKESREQRSSERRRRQKEGEKNATGRES